jgi:HK97 family phage prohead protease
VKTKTERSFSIGVELRAAAGSDFALAGIAASYDKPSKPIPGPNGTFTEYIRKGAFTRALRQKQEVKALLNHNANFLLGRTKNGTLTLTDTPAGLAFRVQLNPKMVSHKDLYASVKRGDISECSFAFAVPKGGDSWSADYSKRTLLDVDLFDISVVTDPAYGGGATSVDARQLRSAQYVLATDTRAAQLEALAKVVAADRVWLAEESKREAADREIQRWLDED